MNRGDIILLAAGSSAVTAVTAPILPPGVALVWYCIAGAVLGAIGAAAIPTKEEPNWRQIAWRICGCAGFGGAVTPLLVRYLGIPVDADIVLGISAIVGFWTWFGGRAISGLSPRELIDAGLYLMTLGRLGKLPGSSDDRR